MQNRDLDDSTRFLLESYKKDIDKLDEKWDQYLVQGIRLEEGQKSIHQQVHKLNKLLTEDNGKPSIMTQLVKLSSEMDLVTEKVQEIHKDLESLKAIVGVPTPKEVRVERWKTSGIVVSAVGGLVTGILSLVHSLM